MNPPIFANLEAVREDERIDIIVRHVRLGKKIGIIVEDQPKADRYLAKIKAQFPGVEVKQLAGPGGTIALKVRAPVARN